MEDDGGDDMYDDEDADKVDDDVMIKTYKSMKLSWAEWLGARQQPKSSKLAHDVLPSTIHQKAGLNFVGYSPPQ